MFPGVKGRAGGRCLHSEFQKHRFTSADSGRRVVLIVEQTENSAYQIKRCNELGTKLQDGSWGQLPSFMLCAGEVILCANLHQTRGPLFVAVRMSLYHLRCFSWAKRLR